MSCGLTKCHDISGVNNTWWNFPAFSMTDEAEISGERTLRLYSTQPDTVSYYSHCFSTLRAQERWACGKNTTFCHSTLCILLRLSLFVCLCVPSSSSLTLMSLCPVLSPISSFLSLHPDHTHPEAPHSITFSNKSCQLWECRVFHPVTQLFLVPFVWVNTSNYPNQLVCLRFGKKKQYKLTTFRRYKVLVANKRTFGKSFLSLSYF